MPARAWPILALLAALAVPTHAAERIRASYFYSYMGANHLDSLSRAGFNRALIKNIGDSMDERAHAELVAMLARGASVGVEVVPVWSQQAPVRLRRLLDRRCYRWGLGIVERDVGCPLDSMFWRATLRDRAVELLQAFPTVQRLVLDLEIYSGTAHHYQYACRCSTCLALFAARGDGEPDYLEPFEQARIARMLAGLLSEIQRVRPTVELGVLDLDYPSFLHRGLILGLLASGVATVNYTERTYLTGATSVAAARAPLEALGLTAPLVGGVALRHHAPASAAAVAHGLMDATDGYFVFTTYSLWQDPTRLGDYIVPGSSADYWRAFRIANTTWPTDAGPLTSPGSTFPPPRIVEVSETFPNPGASGTQFSVALPRAEQVAWRVFDVSGRTIWKESSHLGAGRSTLFWPGTDRNGRVVPGGLYLIRVSVGSETWVRRVALVP